MQTRTKRISGSLGSPPARSGPGTCDVCRGPALVGLKRCWCCSETLRNLAARAAADGRSTWSAPPVVMPLAVFRAGDSLHRVLRGYKDATAVEARRYFTSKLSEHLGSVIEAHLDCVEASLGHSAQSLAVVPSASRLFRSGPAAVPIRSLEPVVDQVDPLSKLVRVQVILDRAAPPIGHLRHSPSAFEVPPVEKAVASGIRRVLLVEDTWVSGATALSAAAALTYAGFEVMAVVVLGRLVDVNASAISRKWWDESVDHVNPPNLRQCSLPKCIAVGVSV